MISESPGSLRVESNIKRWLALGLVLGLTLTGGILYGDYSQRWGPTSDLVAAAKSLELFPRQVGEWSVVEDMSLENSVFEMLECTGYVNRRYIHQRTGQVLSLAAIVGPPGPMAVHTPEICFSSRAYEQVQPRKRIELSHGDSHHSFWYVDFSSRNILADGLRVHFAWSLGDTWVAAESPRYQFAAAPGLYKLQLAVVIPPEAAVEEDDPGAAFLKELIKSDWQAAARGALDGTEANYQ